jgi:TolA-binding protein
MFRRLSVLILVSVLPLSAAAVNREMQELQRDVAQLQELVKALQLSVNEKLAALQLQAQHSAEAAAQANSAVATVQRSLEQILKEQQDKLMPPMVAMGTRMDQVSGGLDTVQRAVSDLGAVMSKLQTQIGDLNNSVKMMQAPAASAPTVAEKAPMPASDLFENADRDRQSGKLDLALQGFLDYLKWYADRPQAAEAQYYVGSIRQSQNDLEGAVKDFDALLVNYPDAKKVPDALFYKGKSLMLLGRVADANSAFKELRRRFPTSDLAKQSSSIKPAR